MKIFLYKIPWYFFLILVLFVSSCVKKNVENSSVDNGDLYGVYATVSSIEPLIVGGKEFRKHSEISVYINGIPANISSLKKGQSIAAIYYKDDVSSHILSIDIKHTLIGPISAIIENKIIVVGQEISFSNLLNENIFLPALGRWVAISGARLPNGEIIANNIDYMPSQAAGLIRGNVAFINSKRIKIGSTNFAVLSSLPPILPGDPVLVRFLVKDSNYRALGVQSLIGHPFFREVQSAIIEDYIVIGDDSYPRLTSNNYIVKGLSYLSSGDKVIIEGSFVPGKIFKVKKLIKLYK